MRTTFLIALLAAAGIAVAPAAPVPKELTHAVWYPTRAGTKLVYQDEGGGGKMTVEIRAAKRTKEGVVIEEEWVHHDDLLPGGPRVTKVKALVSATSGVFWTEMDDEKYVPPYRLLDLPHAAGAGWDTSFTHGTTRVKGTETAGRSEQVVVPAGTFAAIPVSTKYTLGDDPVVQAMTTWFAPDVGMVKRTTRDGEQETVKVTVLVSFTLPRD